MSIKKTIEPTKNFIPVFDSKGHYVSWSSESSKSITDIVLFHGDMRTSRSFDSVCRGLSITNNVYAYDFLGHGDSDWPDKKYKLSDRSEEIINLTQLVSPEGCVAVGHSNGAAALVLAACESPDCFNILILMEPMLVVDKSFQQRASKRSEGNRRTWKDLDDLKHTLISHPLTKNWDSQVIDDVVKYETFQCDDGIDIKWDSMTMAWKHRNGDYVNILELLPKLEMPVLFMVSENKKETYKDVGQPFKNQGRFQKIVIGDTRHNMYMERPRHVADLIQKFILENQDR
ncbi:alpha/beta hydrolase [Dehalococcoidia bacterium]|nr:alpha/beta hydrolase [Dehalococcoidia bacterium]